MRARKGRRNGISFYDRLTFPRTDEVSSEVVCFMTPTSHLISLTYHSLIV